jgi:hypothetical protein
MYYLRIGYPLGFFAPGWDALMAVSFALPGRRRAADIYPRLAPWAAFLRRSAASEQILPPKGAMRLEEGVHYGAGFGVAGLKHYGQI